MAADNDNPADTALGRAGEQRAAQARSQTERQFRLLIQGVKDYAIFLLDPKGHVSTWNPGAEHIKGYTAEEIIGQHFSIFYTEEDRAAGAPEHALEVAAREGRFETEYWRGREEGGRGLAKVDRRALPYNQGEKPRFVQNTRAPPPPHNNPGEPSEEP